MLNKTLTTADIILENALNLIVEQGYAAVSMREIAKKSGIQVGGIYNHFSSKQEILFRLMISHMEKLLAAWQEWPDKGKVVEERFDVFVRFHLSYHMRLPDEIFISYMELRSLEYENRLKVVALRDTYENILHDILHAGVKAGWPVENAAITTRALINMMTGMVAWFRTDGPLTATQLEQLYLDMARRMVGLPVRK